MLLNHTKGSFYKELEINGHHSMEEVAGTSHCDASCDDMEVDV